MPIVPYTIQRSVCKTVNGKLRWFVEYEPILVDVSDEVAAFLKDDDKRERRYDWKIKKQKQDANIHAELSLDEVGRTGDGKDESWKYKHKWINTGLTERGNKKAAQRILDEDVGKFAALLESGQMPESKKQRSVPDSVATESKGEIPTFAEYLKQNLEQRKHGLSPSVAYNYIDHYLQRIEKYFGNDLKITELTAKKVQEFYDRLTAQNLKGVSVKHYACVLHPALREAYKDGYLKMNLIDFLKVPKREKYRGSYYDKNDLEKFFKCIEGNELEFVFKVAAYYGFRRSELLGLRWDAIDFDRKTIQVRHKLIVVGDELMFSDELKTKASCRTLPLMPSIESELRGQLERRGENMEFFGDTYCRKYDDYVFTHADGKMILPNFVTKSLVDIIRKHKLKKIRFHDLRHSCASLMLAEGVPMKQIQEWLGHANFSTTADIYSHLDYSSKLQSADRIAGALDKVSPPVSTVQKDIGQTPDVLGVIPQTPIPTPKESDEQDEVRKLLAGINIPTKVLLRYLRDLHERMTADKLTRETVRTAERRQNYDRYPNYDNGDYNGDYGYTARQKSQKEKEDDYCL